MKPWKEREKSSAGSELLDLNRMIGWPTFEPWRSTSTVKFGCLNVPKSRLKMLTQAAPHDGVAAPAVPAVSTPIVPTPLTMVSAAAVASTLLLKDMEFPSWNHSRTLRTAVVVATAVPAGLTPAFPACNRPR